MKHLYKYIATAIMLLTALGSKAMASAPEGLQFAFDTYDYGHIAEDGGAVRCCFEAINTAPYHIEVTEIVTTCGCTKADYECRSIAPNEGFSFTIIFDPMNRPGRIDKSIYVHVSNSPEPICLRIEGYVEPRERTTDEIYPFDMGEGLRLMSTFHAFGYIEAGKSGEEHIGYINTSEHEIALELQNTKSSGLLEVIAPERIAPHSSGDIILRYNNTPTEAVYGTIEDHLTPIVNGKRAEFDITTYAIAVDNFDNVDDISAPRLAISKNIIKFGEIKSTNTILEHSVELHNEGQSPLIIRNIECNADAVEVVSDVACSIAPGSSTTITIRLHSVHIDPWGDPFVARVIVITNDPIRPMQAIRVNALSL